MRSIAVLAILLGATSLQGASIGVYATTNCDGSSSQVALYQTVTLFVMAETTAEDFAGGLFGSAGYRLSGIPASWPASATPNPTAQVNLGDPFGDGVMIGFSPFLGPGCFLLHTLDLTNTTGAVDMQLDVAAYRAADVLGAPAGTCAWLFMNCEDCPADPGVTCVAGISHVVNPTVPVIPSTWTRVRGLYLAR
jgi:hypothetical protein